MIRGLSSQTNIYQNNNNGTTRANETKASDEQKSGRLEALKQSIENGEYKVNLDKLAQKMAKELS